MPRSPAIERGEINPALKGGALERPTSYNDDGPSDCSWGPSWALRPRSLDLGAFGHLANLPATSRLADLRAWVLVASPGLNNSN